VKEMNLIDIMKTNKLLDWNTLRMGFEKHWISKEDIIDFSINELTSNDETNIILSSLASCENETNENILEMIDKHIASRQIVLHENDEIKKWLLGHLMFLDQLDLPDQEKIDQLQEVYSEFDYPEDMAKCSIYYVEPGKEIKVGEYLSDPLQEMKKVIKSLLFEIKL
jgi:hypothetical protein